jgi:hypothetical protein
MQPGYVCSFFFNKGIHVVLKVYLALSRKNMRILSSNENTPNRGFATTAVQWCMASAGPPMVGLASRTYVRSTFLAGTAERRKEKKSEPE